MRFYVKVIIVFLLYCLTSCASTYQEYQIPDEYDLQEDCSDIDSCGEID